MTNKRESITYEEAVNHYYGGVKEMNRGKLPYTCKCGARQMTIGEIWDHLRLAHNEKLVSENFRKAILKKRQERDDFVSKK